VHALDSVIVAAVDNILALRIYTNSRTVFCKKTSNLKKLIEISLRFRLHGKRQCCLWISIPKCPNLLDAPYRNYFFDSRAWFVRSECISLFDTPFWKCRLILWVHTVLIYTQYIVCVQNSFLNIKFWLSKFSVPVAPLDISKPEETIVRPLRTLHLSEKVMIYDLGYLINTFN